MSKAKKKASAGLMWTEQTFKLADLTPYEKNPRRITPAQLAKLKASIEQDGFHQRMLVTPDGRLIGGHQQLKVLTELGYTEVQALVPNRELTEEEYKRLNVRDNLVAGEWDFEALLEDFEVEELLDFGFSETQISGLVFSEKGKNDADKEWEGMPDYESEEAVHRKIIVSFEDEQSVKDFFALLGQEFTEKTKSIWYPYKERDAVEGIRWKDEGQDEPDGN